MPKTVEYIGTTRPWPELAFTGKQSVWFPGQAEQRSDTEAAQLLATGLFSDVDATQLPEPKVVALSGVVSGAVNRAERGTLVYGPGMGITPTVTSSSVTGLTSGFVAINGEQWFQFTATGVTSGYVELNIPTFEPISASSAVVEYQTDPSQGTPMYLYLGTTGYSLNANWSWNFVAAAVNEPLHHFGRAAMSCVFSGATKSGFAYDTSIPLWTIAKVRVPISNGVTRTFAMRSIRLAPAQGKARLCIVADDGYSSWIRLGMPIMEEYGLTTTSAVIADAIGTAAQYASLSDWQAYLARGHEIVAHGPRNSGVIANLVDGYATNAEAVADAIWHRDRLQALGLMTPEAAKCYILPQGKYGRSAGDTSLLDALAAAGFTTGRGAIIKTPGFFARGTAASSHARMIWPVIGHNYAGAANTPDDATETTNISNLVARIQAIATDRADAHMMLHRVVARGGASNVIEIETDRLRTLAAAIRVEIDAGRLETVKMSAINVPG